MAYIAPSTDSANASNYIIPPGRKAYLQVSGSGKVYVARSKAELVQGGGMQLAALTAGSANFDGAEFEGELWFYTDTAGTKLIIFELTLEEYRRKSLNTSVLDVAEMGKATPDAMVGAE